MMLCTPASSRSHPPWKRHRLRAEWREPTADCLVSTNLESFTVAAKSTFTKGTIMEPRLPYLRLSPAGYRALSAFQQFVETSGLEHSLLELVKMRASQINGCAFCIDMHTKDARALGETEQRIYALNAWRETPFFTERERAALELAESVTKISDAPVAD